MRQRRLVAGVAVLSTLVLIMAACSSSKSSTSTGGGGTSAFPQAVGKKITGGTVTWAEGPQAPPNYIFPIANAQVFSTVNLPQFQQLMYRPLYWFGNDYKATVDYDYSIGQAPTFSPDGKTATIKLNHYAWSDGETVSSRDVVFFMNVLKQEKQNYGAYVPGLFPDNVTSYAAADPTTVTFTFDKAYNPNWLIYNELSQVTPFPLAWDKTSDAAPTPTTDNGHLPDTTPAGAKAVYTYLDGLSKNQASYTTNPIWGVVDGPWKLAAFTNTGRADFVPNPSYSGPVKPTISRFVELPFTSEAAELNVLKTGPANLTIGWLPAASKPQEPSITALGYAAENYYNFSTNFFPLNLHNPRFGPVFSQLYFRQAFQHLLNQAGWIHAFANDTAVPQLGVVPTNPPNPFVSPAGKTDRYPYSLATASSLLSSHGWKVTPNGVTTCQSPGTGPNQCGAGVPAGLGLSFNLDYEAGPVALDQEMKDLKSSAGQVGIQLQLTTHPFAQVTGAATQCKPTEATCKWTAENWGGGWIYDPDYYPTGEELFQTGAEANYSNYSDPTTDQLIAATTTASAATAQDTLNKYQDYINEQLPVVFQPNEAGNPVPGGPTIVSKHLGGFSPNAFTYITPETYYLTQ
jgi:peptide/nickel transport system substrate-binding protein